MKVNKGQGSDLRSRIMQELDQRRQNEVAEQQRSLTGQSQKAEIDVSLSKSIQSELDASTIVEERQERIARIRAAIEKGAYSPSSENIAGALGREIAMEILTARAYVESED